MLNFSGHSTISFLNIFWIQDGTNKKARLFISLGFANSYSLVFDKLLHRKSQEVSKFKNTFLALVFISVDQVACSLMAAIG